jgi:hypothetical protein
MKPEQLTEALESVAAQLDVKVRYESMAVGTVQGAGGLCKVRGEWWVIVDKRADPADKAAVLADALSTFDTTALDLPPRVRDVLDLRRNARGGA